MMQNDPFFDDESYEMESPRPPSKSQLKREATALQDLGEAVVKLSATQLKQMPLSDELLAAVKAAQAMPQRGAHKRQLQFIGKLMRGLDEAEVEAIRTALAAFRAK
jgi:ribosome-associated protein